ncbi:MAG: hypothetical protein Q7U75_08985, partial [Desulfobacterales bacterium]|nr:hypothetical protein [Desulfobacterales bacterium]
DRWTFFGLHPEDEAGALQALAIGKEGSQFGYGRSTEALIKSEQDKLLTGMMLELEHTGHLDAIKRGGRDLNLDIAKEMRRATGGPEAPTGNKVAEDIAKVYSKWIDIGRNERNGVGAYTRALPGFIVKQAHNPGRITGKGRESDYIAWRDTFVKSVSDDTFEGVDPTPAAREKFLRDTYNHLSTGTHLKEGESDWLGGFKGGSANIAKRASQERSIHFKSAKDWYEYNELYGNGTMYDSLREHLMNVGRDIGLMKIWGPNPRAAFDADRAQLLEQARGRNDQDEIKALSGKTMAGKRLITNFEQIDGTANIADHGTMATYGRNIRGWETITKLTNGVLSQFADLFGRAGTMRWNGMNPLEAHANSIRALLEGRPDLEQKEILHRIGSFADGVVGDIAQRLAVGDKLDG